MSFQTIINNGEDYQAADITTAFEAMVEEAGVADVIGGQLEVTENGTPDDTVLVAAGMGLVANSAYAAGGGNQRYFVVRTTGTSVTIPANGSGNPRVDLICLKVDTGATPGVRGSGSSSAVVVTGTAAASPTASAVPNDHLSLATVAVSSGFSTITDSDITDSRVQLTPAAGQLLLQNAEYIQAEDAAGSAHNLLGVDSSDDVIFGNANYNVIQVQNVVSNAVQYRAKGRRTTTQAIPDTTFTSVLFTDEDYDIGGLHSTSVDTSRFTIPADGGGTYDLKSSVALANGTGNRRILRYKVNGVAQTDFQAVAVPVSGSTSQFFGAGEYYLNGGDYVELEIWQNSGGSLNISEATLTIRKCT